MHVLLPAQGCFPDVCRAVQRRIATTTATDTSICEPPSTCDIKQLVFKCCYRQANAIVVTASSALRVWVACNR